MDVVFFDCGVWIIDGDGWCDYVCCEFLFNCDECFEGVVVELLVIYNISLLFGEFGGFYIVDLFCNWFDFDVYFYFDQLCLLCVLVYFLICCDGEVVQFVLVYCWVWYVGVFSFEGCECCNDFFIGIELEGIDFEFFIEVQYVMLVKFFQVLVMCYGLIVVVGYEYIVLVCKIDFGFFFDWDGYYNKMVKIVNVV